MNILRTISSENYVVQKSHKTSVQYSITWRLLIVETEVEEHSLYIIIPSRGWESLEGGSLISNGLQFWASEYLIGTGV